MGGSVSGLSGSARFKQTEGREDAEDLPCVRDEQREVSGCREVVAGRLRSAHLDREPCNITMLASSLSNSRSLRETYFSNILQESSCDGSNGLKVAIIWRDISGRETARELSEAFDKFASQFKYGPFCATVKVGNMYLTWNNQEIVIPQTDISSVFERSIRQDELSHQPPQGEVEEGEASLYATGGHSPTDPVRTEDVEISMIFREDFIVDMSSRASERIDALVDTLVRYNTKFHYGLLTCNCQHFVIDVLTALEAKHLVRRFEDCLDHHARVLEYRGLDVVKEEFNSHQELDNYVNIRIEDMDASELIFCYGHYLLFHAWCSECPQLHTFQCPKSTCRFRELKQRV
jgi:hypothetical protein